MLFEEEKNVYQKAARPQLPADYQLKFEIGFLFNFVSSKSTRFDLEPVLQYELNGVREYRRISLQVEKGLAFLHALDESFYENLLEFSDNRLLKWMTATGNRFIRNHSGSWAHLSAKELVNLRKHYVEILNKLWPDLTSWQHIYILKAGRFSNTQQIRVKLSPQPPEYRFSAELKNGLIVLTLTLLLDGNECEPKIRGGFLLEHNGTLYLPSDPAELTIIDLFKNGPLSFPLTVKKEVVKKYLLSWMDQYPTTISPKLNITVSDLQIQPRVRLSELNESNLMIRPEFSYDGTEVDYGDERWHVEEEGDNISIIRRNKEEEKRLYEYLRTLHASFVNQRNNLYYYLPFNEVMKRGWFIGMLRKVQDEGLSIHGFESLQKFRYSTHDPKITMTAGKSDEYFELRVTIHWGEQEVSLKEIRHAILHHQDTIMLEDGTLGHIPKV